MAPTYSHCSQGWSFTHLCAWCGCSPEGALAQACNHYAMDSVHVNSSACAQGIREIWESAWLVIRLNRATACSSSSVFLFYVIMRLFDFHTTLLFQTPVDLYSTPHCLWIILFLHYCQLPSFTCELCDTQESFLNSKFFESNDHTCIFAFIWKTFFVRRKKCHLDTSNRHRYLNGRKGYVLISLKFSSLKSYAYSFLHLCLTNSKDCLKITLV